MLSPHFLIAGVADPDTLAELGKGRMRSKLPALRKTLTARFRAHHALMLERMLTHVEDLERLGHTVTLTHAA